MPVSVSGIFAIEMEISDGTAAVVSIPATPSTTTYKHVVGVENISKHPALCRIKAALPNGNGLLHFVGSSLGPAEWKKETPYSIPGGVKRNLDCQIEGSGSGTGVGEPIDCVEVWAKCGALIWNQLTSNVPFGISVDVT